MLKWIGAALAIVVLSAALSLALSKLTSPKHRPYDPVAAEASRQIALHHQAVSMIGLLSAPEQYDGKKISVKGLLSLEYEGTGLHLDRAAYDAGLRSNAVWLDRPDWLDDEAAARLDRKYVRVAATFDASRHGAYSAYVGALTDVQEIELTFTASDYQEYLLKRRSAVMFDHFTSVWFLSIFGWLGLFIFGVFKSRRR